MECRSTTNSKKRRRDFLGGEAVISAFLLFIIERLVHRHDLMSIEHDSHETLIFPLARSVFMFPIVPPFLRN